MKNLFSHILTATSKKIILISLILMWIGTFSQISAQTTGDYQSAGDGNWNDKNSWQYYDGTNWIAATQYPGQYNTTYGVVTIQHGHTITISGLTLTGGSIELFGIGEVILDGILLIDYQAAVTIDTPLFIVTPSWGIIRFGDHLNKNSLTLPPIATLIVQSLGIDGGQSNNTFIKVGTTWVKNGKDTFDDLMKLGGANVIVVTTSPDAVCDNASTKFTFTALPNPIASVQSYQWYDANKNPIANATSYTYSTYLSATTTYYVRVTFSIKNVPPYTIESAPIIARFGTNAWTGTKMDNTTHNYNWSEPLNWKCNVLPVQTTDVLIPKGTNPPHIDIINAVCHDLTINAYPGVVIDAGKSLIVNHDLTINGSLKIQSNATTNSGSLIVNGTSTGFVTYNRYLAHGKWFITSAPVFTVPNFDDLNKAKMLNGTSYYFNFLDEPSNHWIPFISSTFPTSLTPGQGFKTQLNSTSKDTIRFDGELNGDVTMPLSSTGNYGWNAVGNPYTSALKITEDMNGFLDKNADVLEEDYNAIYLWSDVINDYQVICKSNLAGYIAWDGFGSASGDAVQAGQGFLINVKYGLANPKVKFYKGSGTGMQVSNTSLALKKSETSWPGITLQATNSGRTRSTMVAFNSDMTTGLDPSYDAGLLSSSDFNLYTHLLEGNNETMFNIQCLPDNMYDLLEVPVGLDLPQAGKVTFRATGVILPEGLYPVLEDRLLHVSVPLNSSNDSLIVNIAGASTGTGRFYLHIGNESVILGNSKLHEASKLTAYYSDQKITIFGTPEQGSKVWLYDMSGRKLGGEYHLISANQNEIPASGLSTGMYLLKIEGKTNMQTLKVMVHNR